MIPIAPTPESSIFTKDYGEAEILNVASPSTAIQYTLAAAQQRKQNNADVVKALNPDSVEAWDGAMFEFNDKLGGVSQTYSQKIANKELTPQQATIYATREGQKYKDLAVMSMGQQKLWGEAKTLYDKDEKGLYDRGKGYQNLDIYKNPDKYADQIPEIQQQLEAIAGDGPITEEVKTKWRAQNGTTWLRPQLTYDYVADEKSRFEPVKTVGYANDPAALNVPGVSGVVNESGQTYNIEGYKATMRDALRSAEQGDFKATEFVRHVAGEVGKSVVIDPNGNIQTLNKQGDDLLRDLAQYGNYDPQAGTINGRQVSPEILYESLMEMYAVQRGKKYAQTDQKISVNLKSSINNKINVSTGGVPDKEQTYWSDVSNLSTQNIADPNAPMSLANLATDLGGKVINRPNTDDPMRIEIPVPSQLAAEVVTIPRKRATVPGGGVLDENTEAQVDDITVMYRTTDPSGQSDVISEAEYNRLPPEDRKKAVPYARVTFREYFKEPSDLKEKAAWEQKKKKARRLSVEYNLSQGSAQVDELNQLVPGLFQSGRKEAEEGFGTPGAFETTDKIKGLPEPPKNPTKKTTSGITWK